MQLQPLLLTFATEREAAPSIEALQASYCKQKEAYQFAYGYLAITGMGAIAAAATTARLLPYTQEVWNYGIAGSLNPDLALGELMQIQSVSKSLQLPVDLDSYSLLFAKKLFPTIALGAPGASLITSDFPIHHPLRKKELHPHLLVDMEGYGIAHAAQLRQKKCRIWKIVSDFADIGGPQLILAQIDQMAQQIAKKLQEHLLQTAFSNLSKG